MHVVRGISHEGECEAGKGQRGSVASKEEEEERARATSSKLLRWVGPREASGSIRCLHRIPRSPTSHYLATPASLRYFFLSLHSLALAFSI